MTSIVRVSTLVLALTMLALNGCRPSAVSGGTKGKLTTDGQPLGEVQISVYRNADGTREKIGFAITADDGTFELVTNGAQESLNLTPGEYCFTLETAGAPLDFAEEYRLPESTPLKLSWIADSNLEWDVPTTPVP